MNILVIGQSGTGKSTAIRTLPPEQTFVLSVLNKPLPFRNASNLYVEATKENPNGNYFASSHAKQVISIIDKIDKSRPDIKYLVIDDIGYVITQQYMDTALQKGYEKFSVLALSFWEILNRVKVIRPDLTCILTMHSDLKEDGIIKPKTIGRMLDEKIDLDGCFTHVLHSLFLEGNYYFLTNFDGLHMAKMPMGMFKDKLIPNDFKLVIDAMNAYYNQDIKQ